MPVLSPCRELFQWIGKYSTRLTVLGGKCLDVIWRDKERMSLVHSTRVLNKASVNSPMPWTARTRWSGVPISLIGMRGEG